MWFLPLHLPRRVALLGAVLAMPGIPAAPAAPAAVPPLIVPGQVTTLDGGAAHGLELRVRAGSFADLAPIDSAGSFAFELPPSVTADSLELLVDMEDRGARRYHPALVRLHRRELRGSQQVVLVPREWRIAQGRYAGTRVEISLERAYRPTCAGCTGFFREGSRLDTRAGAATVPAWPEDRFPLRVAFDRARSDAPITPRDSAAFWRIADEVHEVFGRALFRPVPYSATLPADEDVVDDVVLVWVVPSLRTAGRSTLGFYRSEVITGSVWLQRTALIGEPSGPSLVAHELLHALGFNHTCSWRSVLADTPRCPRMRSPVPTPEDVAYIEIAYAMNARTRGSTTRWAMEAALAGERWSQRNLAAADAGR
jgi:hypothetical protein